MWKLFCAGLLGVALTVTARADDVKKEPVKPETPAEKKVDEPKAEEKKPDATKPATPRRKPGAGAAGGRGGEMIFKRLDKDGDGKISADEFKAIADQAKQRGRELSGDMLDKLFKRLDKDGDGYLSADEMKAFGQNARKGKKKPDPAK